jgi:hypothetical protein
MPPILFFSILGMPKMNKDELRAWYEKQRPMFDCLLWVVGSGYECYALNVDNPTDYERHQCREYNATWQGFQLAAEIFEPIIAKQKAEIARLSGIINDGLLSTALHLKW